MKLNKKLSVKLSPLTSNFLMAGGMAALVAALLLVSTGKTSAADGKLPAATKTSAKKTVKTDPPARQKLDGAELYAVNCGRCHPERDPIEYTPRQWKTLMIYMRVRANLPANQARAILKYLEDQAGQ